MTSKAPRRTASTPSWSNGGTAQAISMVPTAPRRVCGTCPRSPTFARCSVSDRRRAGAQRPGDDSGALHVTFVCSGNICRSPMAAKMFAHQIDERGLAGLVRVTSAGTGGWHAGDRADDRAGRVLHDHGYPSSHQAAQVDDDHLAADLVIAMGRNHARI